MSFDLVNSVFALLIVALIVGTMILFALDVLQNEDAIRRNYPVIGRFRGLFTTLGEFFRQYFFAMDRGSCRLTVPSGIGLIMPAKGVRAPLPLARPSK